jgi:CPA2 family monovalent cation:H+ antiporter-2
MEDLVVMLLLVLLSTEASGARLSSHDVVATVGRLLGFLALILVGGMLLVPRAMRLVVSLRRNETTLVAAVGLAFLFAYLAHAAGFSVALGAFLAGALVRESGRAHQVLELLEPVRHVFAAIFFVAVGMLVSLPEAFRAWPAVLAFVAVVVIGKIVGVALGGFLSGFGVRTSIQAGMTLAQIGEFSFVIAGIGLTSGAVSAGLYPVAVTVSVITILLVPLLMRLADPLSATIDRRLPKPVQTFVTLYESWVELLRRQSRSGTAWRDIRRPVGWMVLDASVVTGVFLATTGFRAALLGVLASLGLGATPSVMVLAAGSLLLALPFAVGLVTSARRVALRLAERAMPHTGRGVDQAHAPRGTLTAVVQIVLVVLFGLPFLVITQPFMSAWPGAAIIGGLLVLLTISFWRSARNLDSHARAGAELIVDVLARQGRDKDEHDLERVQEMLPGMGTIVAFHVEASCQSVGQSLGELNLRGLTGVTVVALIRGVQRLVFPKATEVLQEGDVLALTGSHEAIAAADRLLLGIEHAIPSGESVAS